MIVYVRLALSPVERSASVRVAPLRGQAAVNPQARDILARQLSVVLTPLREPHLLSSQNARGGVALCATVCRYKTVAGSSRSSSSTLTHTDAKMVPFPFCFVALLALVPIQLGKYNVHLNS